LDLGLDVLIRKVEVRGEEVGVVVGVSRREVLI